MNDPYEYLVQSVGGPDNGGFEGKTLHKGATKKWCKSMEEALEYMRSENERRDEYRGEPAPWYPTITKVRLKEPEYLVKEIRFNLGVPEFSDWGGIKRHTYEEAQAKAHELNMGMHNKGKFSYVVVKKD